MSLNCRCISVGKDEEDYRPLFENFLQDLLVTLNRPDWPAAEVLLTLLGRLLVSKLLLLLLLLRICLKMKLCGWMQLDKTFSVIFALKVEFSEVLPFLLVQVYQFWVGRGGGEGTPFLLLLFYFRLWDCCQSTAPLLSVCSLSILKESQSLFLLLMWLRSWIFSPLVLFSLTQIVTFNNKANDVSLRVSAIDYLGVVAAHLRKDAVNSQQDTESITEILIEVTEGEKIFVAVYTVSCNLRWISGQTYFKPVC